MLADATSPDVKASPLPNPKAAYMRKLVPLTAHVFFAHVLLTALFVAGFFGTATAQSGPTAEADTTLAPDKAEQPIRTPATAESFRQTVLGTQQFQDSRREGLANRWRLLDPNGLPVPRASLLNPYAQNPLKGDFPIAGQNTFGVLTILENPTTAFNNQENSESVFNNTLLGAFELFNGLTVFRPKSWAVKGAIRHVSNSVGDVSVSDVGLADGFAELKLVEIGNDFYDFASVRAGIQAFKSDFNGLIFNSFDLGAQLFGTMKSNRIQFAVAGFSPRTKNLAGLDLDLLDQDLNQTIGIGTIVIEDFLRPGFNGAFSVHFNQNTALDDAPANTVEGADLSVIYLGFASAGNFGRFIFNPAFYLATGTDDFNPVAGQETTISAFLAGAAVAYPKNWITYRGAAFIASGDSDPNDDTAQGFDGIADAVNLFGGGNSFVISGAAGLGNRPNSLFPSGRVIGNRPNFVNPGIMLVNAGFDAVITPKMFIQLDYNFLQLNNTATIDPDLSSAIGHDISAALKYRLFLNENLVLQAGGGFFIPGDGAKALGILESVMTGNVKLVALF